MKTLFRYRVGFVLVVILISALNVSANAQEYRGPNPVPYPPATVAPVDTPYPGTISLLVDLTDNTRRLANVHETVPVQAGELTLLYPKWIPGNHSPTGPISKIAGLTVSAGGKRLEWRREVPRAPHLRSRHDGCSRCPAPKAARQR